MTDAPQATPPAAPEQPAKKSKTAMLIVLAILALLIGASTMLMLHVWRDTKQTIFQEVDKIQIDVEDATRTPAPPAPDEVP